MENFGVSFFSFMVVKRRKFGWYSLGGFRGDPQLTEADKRFYEKRLRKHLKLGLLPEEKREKRLAERILRKKEIEIPKTREAWLERLRIYEREKREYARVEKRVKEKDSDWLGRWLQKFSTEGDFWSKPKREKLKESDWL